MKFDEILNRRVKKNKSSLLILIFIPTILFYLCNWLFSKGFNGGADSITHYQISRYCWQHTYLLIDQWGKPIFTILFSPIAQLGFKAVAFVNMILIFLGAYWAYRIAQLLEIKSAILVPFFVLWAPIICGNAISGLTEPICSLFLIGYIYLALKEKWMIAGIILSFMPFARSEGYVIILLVLLFYIFTGRKKHIPYLFIGTLAFGFLGYQHTGNPYWVLDSNPYVNTGIKVYGHGPIYWFLLLAIPTFGWMFLPALVQTYCQLPMIKGILKSSSWPLKQQVNLWLVTGSFWAYFLAHTVLWWQGLWASLGLIRVMMVIAVPMALMAAQGWDDLKQRKVWPHGKNVKYYLVVLTVLLPILIRPLKASEIEIFPDLGQEEYVNLKVARYFESHSEIVYTKTFTGHPYLNLIMDIDPFDVNINDRLHNWKTAKSGDWLIWDGHFGPNEEQLHHEELDADPSFELVEIFKPDTEFRTLNDYFYEIRLYRKR